VCCGHEYLPDQYLIRIAPDKAEDIREQVEIVNGLKALFDAGALSLEEFEMKKNEVMGFTRQ